MEDEMPSSSNKNDQLDFFDSDNMLGAVDSLQGQIISLMLKGSATEEGTPENAPELIKELIRLYKRCKSILMSVVPIYENFVISKIVNFCYLWRINDTRLVADVLGNYYALRGNFDAIFKLGGGITGSQWDFNESAESLEFFLKHCKEGRLCFHGRRFIEVAIGSPFHQLPIDYAIENLNYEMVLKLARYGATVRTLDENPNGVNEVSAVTFLTISAFRRYKSGYKCLRNDERALRCLQVVLRITKESQPMQIKQRLGDMYQNLNLEDKTCWTRFMNMVCTHIPNFQSRMEEPLELKHLCRNTIRNTLNKNWQLPTCIETLLIPECLKLYLDLMDD